MFLSGSLICFCFFFQFQKIEDAVERPPLHHSRPSPAFCDGELIPDICHERHEYIRVNFFWPV